MRGPSTGVAIGSGSVEILVRTLAEEFPELDRERLRHAVERATARIASSTLDTEGYQVVDLHLQRAEATDEASERAAILRELSANLEERNDADRALVVRLSAFAEHPIVADLDPLLRLARLTQRYAELPLDAMNGLIEIHDEGAVQRLGAKPKATIAAPHTAALSTTAAPWRSTRDVQPLKRVRIKLPTDMAE